MLSPKTQYNLANAKSYFQEHLSVGDYYAEQERVQGEWIGAGAVMLGLSGAVKQADFLALCDNQHPGTGERLTQRQKTTRRDASGEGKVANRRVFFDFTISPPKSVSIAALVGGDERITAAHAEAFRVAAAELERFAATRVHRGREISDRPTGNIIAALFQHDTSRALDPHLHTHCILFNATHDAEEGRWKALQNHDLLAAQKYVENIYYHELARALRGFGYTVVNAARGDFEIAEVSPELRERFSKRHREIDEKTRELLAAEPDKRGDNVLAIRKHIAHKERAKKLPGISLERLREFWLGQLGAGEQPISHKPAQPTPVAPAMTAAEAVVWAEEHLFERRSVVREHELWRHALSAARGHDLSVAEVKAETARRGYIRAEHGKLSTRDVLTREWTLVELARDGIGAHAPFAPSALRTRSDLAPDQRRAFAHILGSTDLVTLFRGGAGTGKSYVLRRIQEALEQVGAATCVLAPQRQQVLDLGRDGLQHAQTLSEFLQRGVVPRGAVVIVDEAGQVGGRQLLDLLRLVKQHDGRVILSGDTRQHGPVEASDALRAIERFSGLRPAELDSIRRQDPERGRTSSERNRIQRYRKAVEAAAEGNVRDSFAVLDDLGAVIECCAGAQSEQLADAFLQLAASGETALVVSQTRAEVRQVNERIRAGLQAQGTVHGPEHRVIALEPVDLTLAQMTDARFYPAGSAIVLNRDCKGFKRGSHGKLIAANAAGAVVEVDGKVRLIAPRQLDRLTVCQPRELALCCGDRLQLKANSASADGRKLANGEIVAIADFAPDGSIRLEDGRTLPPTYRQFLRGYAVTSYGSQGKTVDHVLFADSAVRAATNAEQWYVTISRGRKSVRIFTSDKTQLRESAQRSGHRELALDLGRHPAAAPRRSRHVREQLLRGVRRGRELARRMCSAAMRLAWNSPTKTQSTIRV
jgi:conjugative relaxase-like TrwC/TraI family protein